MEKYRTVDGVLERYVGGQWVSAFGTALAPDGPALSDRLVLRCMCEVDGREQIFEYLDGGDRSVKVVPMGSGVAVSVNPRDVAVGHLGMIIHERSDVPVGASGTIFQVPFSVLEVLSVIRSPAAPQPGRLVSRLEEAELAAWRSYVGARPGMPTGPGSGPHCLPVDLRLNVLVRVLSELLP